MMILLYFAAVIVTIALVVRAFTAMFFLKAREDIVGRPVLHAVLLAFALFIWFVPWGAPAGKAVAAIDAARGNFRLFTTPFQKSARERITLSRILKDRYGISSSPMRGCFIFSRNAAAYERAYDTAMIPAIAKHFRRDILAECAEAARSERMPGN